MPHSTVLVFSENIGSATFAQGLTFIERTRRQLHRFDFLPHTPGASIAPEDAAESRQLHDELQADIQRSLA